MITMPIEIYTDGSSIHQPGQKGGTSGLAYIIRYWDTPEGAELPEVKTIELSQAYRLSTNNRMEIKAGILGVQAVIANVKNGTFQGVAQINLSTDSEYFAKAINQRWLDRWSQNNWMTAGFQGSKPKPVRNQDLWEEVLKFQSDLQQMGIAFSITHVPGHAGHEFNERCDQLAVAASKNGTNYLIDEGYENTIAATDRR